MNIILTLVYLLLLSIASIAAAEGGDRRVAAGNGGGGEDDPQCKAAKENEAKASSLALPDGAGGENTEPPAGSGAFRNCVKLSRFNFKTLHTANQNTSFKWRIMVDGSEACVQSKCETDENKRKAAATKCQNQNSFAANCDAAAYMINVAFQRDWNSPDATNPAGANKNQNQNQGASGAIVTNYGCKSIGIETVDYEPCIKFQTNSQNIEIVKQFSQSAQSVWYQGQALDAQEKAMKDMKNGNSATAAQQALLTGTENQKKVAETGAAIDTAKAAYLVSMYNDMPDYDTLVEKCKGWNLNNEQMSGLLTEDPKRQERICNDVTKATSGFKIGFLQNGEAKSNMKSALLKAGLDVANDILMAKLLGDRAKDIKNSIANIDSFKPIDPVAPKQDDALLSYCQVQANANDPKCILPELGRTTDLMNDNVINFGSTGAGTSYKDKSTNPFTGDTSKAVGNTPNRVIGGVGSSISSNQEKGGIENPAAAASAKAGGGAAPGGGGGAGSSGGGGGGGSAPGGGLGAPGSPGVAAITKAKYDGGAGFSILGGSGINGKSKSGAKDDSNPFGKLFNKDKGTNVLNFRDIASQKIGSKSDNIFEMISRKYGEVNNDKRLLEYELAK
jgi:hypothetical protein